MISGQILDGKNIIEAENLLQSGDVDFSDTTAWHITNDDVTQSYLPTPSWRQNIVFDISKLNTSTVNNLLFFDLIIDTGGDSGLISNMGLYLNTSSDIPIMINVNMGYAIADSRATKPIVLSEDVLNSNNILKIGGSDLAVFSYNSHSNVGGSDSSYYYQNYTFQAYCFINIYSAVSYKELP